MKTVGMRWPHEKRIAVIFNICLEAWSDGKAPGITPMGNPLPPTAVDLMAISWASYGVRRGIFRLIDMFARHGAKASVMVSAIIAERSPDTVKAIAQADHEIISHSYAMDVIPAMLSEADERKNIERCTRLLESAAGSPIRGWLSPRGTPSPRTAQMLSEAGYQWYGDVFDDDLPYLQRFGDHQILAIPLSTDVNDMPSLKYGSPPSSMLDAFNESLEAARENVEGPVKIDVTIHAHIYGRPRGAYYVSKIIEQAVAARDVWVGTRREIADHFLAQTKH
jgi:peptidoglycan/xylan/chitin deacetylase (PgdA/CDA1 family)